MGPENIKVNIIVIFMEAFNTYVAYSQLFHTQYTINIFLNSMMHTFFFYFKKNSLKINVGVNK